MANRICTRVLKKWLRITSKRCAKSNLAVLTSSVDDRSVARLLSRWLASCGRKATAWDCSRCSMLIRPGMPNFCPLSPNRKQTLAGYAKVCFRLGESGQKFGIPGRISIEQREQSHAVALRPQLASHLESNRATERSSTDEVRTARLDFAHLFDVMRSHFFKTRVQILFAIHALRL